MENTESNKAMSDGVLKVDPRTRTIKRLNRLIVLLMVMVGLVIAVVVIRTLNSQFAQPKTYYEYQLQTWNQVLLKKPKDMTARTRIAQIYIQMGQDRRAEAMLRSMIKDDPKFMPARYYMALIFSGRDDLKQAEKYFLKAISLTENDKVKALPAHRLAGLYEKQDKIDKAIKYYKIAIRGEPLMWNPHYKLGGIYEKKGDLSVALAYYEQAALFNPAKKIKKSINKIKKELGT